MLKTILYGLMSLWLSLHLGGCASPRAAQAPSPVRDSTSPAPPAPAREPHSTEDTISQPERPALVVSGEGSFWNVGSLSTATAPVTLTVDASVEYQEWWGFGGSFNESGWDALSVLSAAERERALRLLFSASAGANLAWGRIPIGASDYALRRYSLNETAGDLSMAHFSIDHDRANLIPFIKAAQTVKPNLKFWGSMWTPPTWMKTIQKFDASNELPDKSNARIAYKAKMKGDAATLQALALYLARFAEEYAKEGVPISQIHTQNEPGYATRYPSCWWDEGLLGKFIAAHLGPTFKARGLATEIWLGTLSNEKTYDGHIGGLTKEAKRVVKGIGLQWGTVSKAEALVRQGYRVVQTEHRCGNYPWESNTFNPNKPANDYTYAVTSWGHLRQWLEAGVSAYNAWNMILDSSGKNIDHARPWPQNALLVVDRQAKTLTATPVYYVFRHFSYFVDPGARRIKTTGGEAIAFRNPDGSIVTVLHNPANEPLPTTVGIGDSRFQVQLPARGWATVNWDG